MTADGDHIGRIGEDEIVHIYLEGGPGHTCVAFGEAHWSCSCGAGMIDDNTSTWKGEEEHDFSQRSDRPSERVPDGN